METNERRGHFVQLSNYPTQAKSRLEWATRRWRSSVNPVTSLIVDSPLIRTERE
jgi:hypothetical protein